MRADEPAALAYAVRTRQIDQAPLARWISSAKVNVMIINGTVALLAQGSRCPYAGGAALDAIHTDVVAIGKLARYGDSVTRYLVRLADGTEMFVKASHHSQSTEAWLRNAARAVKHPGVRLTRDEGWRLIWADVQHEAE